MARRDQEVSEPYVHPEVQSPTALGPAAAYGAGLQARRAAARLPKTVEPVAGGPTPALPTFDTVQPGMTLAQQGELARRVKEAEGGSMSFVEMPVATPSAPTPANLGLLPIDMLPNEAQRDPAFQQGPGSMYASNQPHLALKYGIVRNGQFIPPQRLNSGRPQLRGETIRDMEKLAELRRHQQEDPRVGSLLDNDKSAEEEAARGPAGAAARVGNVPGDASAAPISEEEKRRLAENVSKMDEFDFDSFRQMMMRDILNNPDQKEIIEARLKPLSIDDLITRNAVKQEIPISPGVFSITLRSMSGEEDLAIKRLIMQESKSIEMSDRYFLDKYGFMTLTVGLVEINNKPIGPDVNDKDGNFNDDNFWRKFNRVLKLPLHMLASVGLNQFWFEQRVRKLFVVEKVGNG